MTTPIREPEIGITSQVSTDEDLGLFFFGPQENTWMGSEFVEGKYTRVCRVCCGVM